MGDGAAEECRWAELGMKIACGFEMLMTDRMYAPKTGKGASAVPSEDGDVDLSRDAKWRKLRARLQTTGYFQGQIEGSEMHTKLLLAAQQSYLASQRESIEGDDDSGNGDDMFDIHSSPQVEIPRILAQSHTAHPTDDAFDTMLEHSGRWEVRAFDDSWMRVDPAEVERMLRERSGVDGKEVGDEAMTDRAKKNDDGVPVVPTNPATTDESQAEFDLRAMLEKFQQFLGAQSGVDGVDTDEMDPA